MFEKKKFYLITFIMTVIILILIFILFRIWVSITPPGDNVDVNSDTELQDNTEDNTIIQETSNEPEEETVNLLTASGGPVETQDITKGIDVARYQGTIDWEKVAAQGVDFAMIRVGFRTQQNGIINEDTNAKYNLWQAAEHGIQTGVYFFSTAVSDEEAVEEADWVADFIAPYAITYPVVYNSEGFLEEGNRQYSLTIDDRTAIAATFMDEIYNRGYTPMFYGPKKEMEGNTQWDMDVLQSRYRIWVAEYSDYNIDKSSYTGTHVMWQYTNQGIVDGIDGNVDMDIAYFGYQEAALPKDTSISMEASPDPEANTTFTDKDEMVTAKDEVNLRSTPNQGSEDNIVGTLKNGDTAKRTGESVSGWSRLDYNGQIVYCISNYLTTDLAYEVPVANAQTDDGIKTKFTPCSDTVTAKEEVNLRLLPSVTNPDASVVAVLKHGETVERTGVNEAYGWSRVEYNGQILYCITSYLTTAD